MRRKPRVDQDVLNQFYVLVALLIAICYVAFPPRWSFRRKKPELPPALASEERT